MKYNIIMNTPIGSKYGTMHFNFIHKQVSGTLELLERSTPFDGTVDEDGNLTIHGQLITLMQTINYTATGKINENAIEITLRGERNNFKITGRSVPESEVRV